MDELQWWVEYCEKQAGKGNSIRDVRCWMDKAFGAVEFYCLEHAVDLSEWWEPHRKFFEKIMFGA